MITDILEENVVQPLLVSTSAVRLAAETVRSIMKIDDIVSETYTSVALKQIVSISFLNRSTLDDCALTASSDYVGNIMECVHRGLQLLFVHAMHSSAILLCNNVYIMHVIVKFRATKIINKPSMIVTRSVLCVHVICMSGESAYNIHTGAHNVQ